MRRWAGSKGAGRTAAREAFMCSACPVVRIYAIRTGTQLQDCSTVFHARDDHVRGGSCRRTHAGSGLMCGRSATTTVGTVSSPPVAARTAAAPAGSRQMFTQCSREASRPSRRRSRRQYSTARPPVDDRAAVHGAAARGLGSRDRRREDQGRVDDGQQHEQHREDRRHGGVAAEGGPRRGERASEQEQDRQPPRASHDTARYGFVRRSLPAGSAGTGRPPGGCSRAGGSGRRGGGCGRRRCRG